MRKLLLSIGLIICSALLFGQPTATLRVSDVDLTGLVPGDKVYVPVYVDDISAPGEIFTMQLFIGFDHTVLSWDGTFANPLTGVQNFHPNFPYGTTAGSWFFNDNGTEMACIWDDPVAPHIMPPGGMFFEYKFTYLGGTTNLTWGIAKKDDGKGATEMYDGNFDQYTLTLIDGFAGFPNFDVTFHVTSGGIDLDGADVTVGSQTITTDNDGNAVFNLPNGNYTYQVTKAGYVNKTGSFTVAGVNLTIEVVLNLVGSEFDVTFQVTSGGNNLEGATVTVGSETAITNTLGEAVISLPDGNYSYSVSKYGYTTQTDIFTVAGAAMFIPVDLPMEPHYDIIFHVTDEALNNLDGAMVAIAGVESMLTDLNGEAMFSLIDGAYDYTVSKGGYTTETGSITVAGSGFTVEVLLMALYDVTFHVTADGSDLQGATITVGTMTKLTNATGNAVFSLPDDSYTYTVAKTGYEEITGNFTVAGAPQTIEVAMVPAEYEVTFHVTDFGTGLDLENALVTIGTESFPTNASGIAIFSLPDGEHFYTITKAGYYEEAGFFNVIGVPVMLEVAMITIPTYPITIHVASDGVNLAGAEVTITGYAPQTTPVNGSVVFDLGSGIYDYTVTKLGYITQAGSFIVENAGFTIEVNMPLQPFDITFHVTSGGISLAGATVTVTGYPPQITPGNGNVIFPLVNGTYSYTVTKPGYNTVNGNVTVNNATQTIDVDMVLTLYDITFVVKDQNNLPVQGAVVTVTGFPPLTTPANGTVVFQLTNGTYAWTVTKAGYDTQNGNVTVNSATQTVNVTLPQTTYATTFVVKDQNNQPVQGAVVTVTGFTPQTTPANGTVVFNLPNGTYPWTATKAGYTPANGNVVVSGAAQTVNVTLPQITYATTFVVKDQGNLPLANAVVTVNGQSQTTPTNGTVVFQLVNGTYPYSVVKDLYQEFEGTVVVNNAAQTVNVNMTLIGIEDITSSSFNVYPNPSNGTFNLTTSAVMGYDSNVTVYDLAGKLVYTSKLEGNDLNVIDLSAQEKGMYIMQIIVEDKVYNKTLVIQ